MSEIARLLSASLAAHMKAKVLRAQKKRRDARAACEQACALREQAHADDPEHRDPGWRDLVQGPAIKGREPSFKTHHEIHDDMMAFYKGLGVTDG